MIKRIFFAINIFLFVILIAVGLDAVRSLRPVDIEVLPKVIEARELFAPQPAARPLSHYAAVIGERDLFGSLPPDIDEEILAPLEVLPPTRLRLRLKGTIYSSNPLFSRAIIEDLGSRKESLYRLGDLVAGAKIVRIDRNQVVVEREGVREVLLMAHGEGMLARREEPIEPLAHIQPVKPLVELPVDPLPETVVLGEREIVAATEAASKIMAKLRIDPRNLWEVPANIMEAIGTANEVLTRARIRPHFSRGRLRGITVTDIHPGSIYERIGLRSGDIIKEINGHRVNSIRGILQIYNEVRQQPIVTISIDRGGRAVTLVHRIGGN